MSLSKTSPPVSNANPVGNGPLPTARLPASARVPASDPKNECNPHLQKRISQFVLHTRYEDLPPDVLHEAKRALIDTIGVAAGAQCLPIANACRRFASLSGETEPTTLSGSTRWTSPLWFDPLRRHTTLGAAALCHALTVDGLDSHDQNSLVDGHAGVALVPAALAFAGIGRKPMTGKELLASLAVAYEVEEGKQNRLGGRVAGRT